jgi:hypothetical protein
MLYALIAICILLVFVLVALIRIGDNCAQVAYHLGYIERYVYDANERAKARGM